MGTELSEKVVLVTGGARGIGHASAARIAQAGATVVITDVLADEGERSAATIRGAGAAATFIPADLQVESDVAALIDQIVSTHGRLDGAFNNAGVMQRGTLLHELTLQEWEHAIRVDLTGVFLCMKHQVRAMLGHGGSIVNTASALGQFAIAGASEYVSAKHGVIGLTRAGSVEYSAKGIRVNAILPGVIRTFEETQLNDYQRQVMAEQIKRHPIGRFGEPEEIGDAAVWLLSSASSFVTGAALAVDGGSLAG